MDLRLSTGRTGLLAALLLGFGVLVSGCSGAHSAVPNVSNVPSEAGSRSASQASHADVNGTERLLANVTFDPNVRVLVTNVYSHVMPVRGQAARSMNPKDVTFHGGKTVSAAGSIDVYVNPTAHVPESQWGFPNRFIDDYSLSKMDHIMDEYTGATDENRYPDIGKVVITHAPTRTWNNTDVKRAVQTAINATGLTGYGVVYHIYLVSGQKVCTRAPYPDGCYLHGTYGTNYCAWHASGNFFIGTVSEPVLFTLEPWQKVRGCSAPIDTIQSDTASTLSHEMSEIFTDPDGHGWYNVAYGEIGDICATNYGTIPMFPGDTEYNIQGEWLNSQHDCAYGPTGLITEFPSGSFPDGITSTTDGNLWFTEPGADAIGRITPAGVVTQFVNGITAGAAPLQIAQGIDGNLWFTEYGGNKVGRITTAGVVTEFSAGISANSGPFGITAGPGGMWFTENYGDRIGRITPKGVVTEFSNGITSDANPTGIAYNAGSDDMWFAESVYGVNKIGRITQSGHVTEFSKGFSPFAGLQFLSAGPDGNVWFTEEFTTKIGRIDEEGTVTEFSNGITANPYGITAGADGNLWFTEYTAVGRITVDGVVTEFSKGVSPGAYALSIASGADDNLWFTEYNANNIGRTIQGGLGKH
jgi:virginiamycin B lyase